MKNTPKSIGALVGVALSSASALLALWLLSYSYAIGGIPRHDPLLVASFRTGLVVSAFGAALTVLGLRQVGRLKWLAVAWALGGAAFWSAMALWK